MFFKRVGGHGHGHHRKHGHGGKHNKIGRNFKHADHILRKHHFGRKATDFGRRCFSESELPNVTNKNMESRCPGELERYILKTYFNKKYHGKRGQHCFKKSNKQNSNIPMPEIEEEENNKHHQRHCRFDRGHGHKKPNRDHHHTGHCGKGDFRRGRGHHGGRQDHGPSQHQRGCKRHGWCWYKQMVDAAVNTDTNENITDATHEPNMDQDVQNDATQEETQPLNVDQVTEVTDNLEKASLEQ